MRLPPSVAVGFAPRGEPLERERRTGRQVGGLRQLDPGGAEGAAVFEQNPVLRSRPHRRAAEGDETAGLLGARAARCRNAEREPQGSRDTTELPGNGPFRPPKRTPPPPERF